MRLILISKIGKVFLLLLFVGCVSTVSRPSSREWKRPAEWAQPIPFPRIKNFYEVNDNIYRSAQPEKEQLKELEKFGIKEILNLRTWGNEKDKGTRLKVHKVGMYPSNILDDDVITAMKIIKYTEGPILIHCHMGADRSGLICAMYRIIFQKWSKEKAIDEMIKGGFGFHKIWYSNIIEYIRDVDIESIKSELEGMSIL